MLIVELNRGVAALDEYLWTSSGDPLSGGERVDPVRIPVEDDGGWDLDNLRFGSYVAADRDDLARFNRWTQHLDNGGVRWDDHQDGWQR